jgi:hypothetical protein
MGVLPPGAPEWLLAVGAVLAVVGAGILGIAGPLRAVQALLHAVAGILRSCNEIREEWRKLRSPVESADRPPEP